MTTTTTALEQVKKLSCAAPNIADFQEELDQLNERISFCDQQLAIEPQHRARCCAEQARLKAEIDNHFGIESQVITHLKKQLVAAQNKEYALGNKYRNMWMEYQRRREDILLACAYPQMPTEPLRWRDEKGFPLLGLFSLERPEMLITPRGVAGLSERINEFYSDVMVELAKQTKDNQQYCIRANFQGLIPKPTREKIIAVRQNHFLWCDILILAEVTDWKTGVIDIDPLVLIMLRNNGHFYIMDSFDITPLEECAQTNCDIGDIY